MKQTELLARLLEKAEAVKNEFNGSELCAFHIAIAFSDFCSSEYNGFSISDNTIYPNWYEEERLRLIYGKALKMSYYFRLRLKKIIRENAENPDAFDFAECEKVAALRNNDVLSADLVFLCALKELANECSAIYKAEINDDTIISLLEYIDANIFDYTAKAAKAVCDKLMEKVNMAAAKRDWKPAAKFAEPQELVKMAFAGIEAQYTNDILTIKIPNFFGKTKLNLTIHKVDDVYYIHDNKCALKFLAKNLKDTKKYDKAIKNVCSKYRIYKGSITGSFVNVYGFVDYLRDLVFVAHADLYYPRAQKQLCFKDKDYIYIPDDKAEPFDAKSLINMLRESIGSYYDEDAGLCCNLSLRSSPFSTRFYFLIETLCDGQIRVSDKLKGKYEGELLEACYWYNDDKEICVFSKFFFKLASRFGGEFDGKDFYISDKSGNFQSAFFRFSQLAMLISRLGQDIALPKLKGEVK